MGRYVNIDKVLKELHLNHKDVIYIDKNDTAKRIEKIPSIDLADYVPKEFHDKTCEAMAKAHQEEIADMVRVVRCKECDMSEVYQSDSNGVMARYCKAFTPTRMVADDDYCSYGERKDKCKECWYWSEVHKRCENKCGCQFKPYGERREP